MKNEKRCILIVDDEQKMVRALKDLLRANGFDVLEAYDGEEALSIYYEHNSIIDLILLDVMLPKLDGFAVLNDIRTNFSLTPVIMLTARDAEYDQLKGLQCGADDYITKNFSPTILLARIETVLRRVGKGISGETQQGDIVINTISHTAFCAGHEIILTRREFELLHFLMLHPSQTLTREQLLNSVWGYNFTGEIRTVDTHIKQLRIKLNSTQTLIKTVHGVGYKFELIEGDA